MIRTLRRWRMLPVMACIAWLLGCARGAYVSRTDESRDAAIVRGVPSGERGVQSSAPVTMTTHLEVKAIAITTDVSMESAELSDMAGLCCEAVGHESASADRPRLRITRFASFGRMEEPFKLDWVVSIVEESGSISGRRISGGEDGYEVTFSGKMELSVQLNDSKTPIRLMTRSPATLKGMARAWPPRGAVLTLAEGPVYFYHEQVIADSSAPPFSVIESARLSLGDTPSRLFVVAPSVTGVLPVETMDAASIAESGHRAIRWEDRSDSLIPFPLLGYNLYRSSTPDDSRSWQLVTQIEGTRTHAIDTSSVDAGGVGYMVTHRIKYPAGYEYEGIPGKPFLVGSVR